MNKVILMGRLTRDPDIRWTQGQDQKCTARFTIAIDRKYAKEGEERQADFVSCVAFGKTAEFFERYITQGVKVAVTGRIQTGSYTNRDGQKIYTTDVVVEEAEFAESKSTSGQRSDNGANGSNATGQQSYSSNSGAYAGQQGQNATQNGANGTNFGANAANSGISGGMSAEQRQQYESAQLNINFNEGFAGVDDAGLPFN